MNKSRRKEIKDIQAMFNRLEERLTDILQDVQSIEDDEQDAFDNMPEGLQNSDRGADSQAAIDALGTTRSTIEEMISMADEVSNSLEEAAQ